MRLIDADALIERMYHDAFETDTDMQKWDSGCWIRYKMFENAIDEAPSIEPNLILPERMERGDTYEVGETIVVMNHDDYYDLLCESWMPKRGEWIMHIDDLFPCESTQECSICHAEQIINGNDDNFCPNCGADMREREGE